MESFFSFLVCLLFLKKKRIKKRILLYNLRKNYNQVLRGT